MEKLAAQEGIDYDEYLLESTRRLKIARLGEPGDVAEARRLSRNRRSEMDSRSHHRCRWWSEQGRVNLAVIPSCGGLGIGQSAEDAGDERAA